MARRQRWTVVFGLVLALALWGLARPAQLGGGLSYMTIVGSGMEPRLHSGDLVIVRGANDYEVGDVAAYRSPDLGRIVLHRIVGREGDRFVLKGDNNTWIDAYQPSDSDFAGTLWLRVPLAGTVVNWLRTPRNAVLMVAVAAVVALVGAASAAAFRRGRRRLRRSMNGNTPPAALRFSPWEGAPATAAVLGILSAALLLLGIAAFTRPPTRLAASEASYSQTGKFTYDAAVAPGPVYEGAGVRTGDPVFLQLVSTLAVDLAYEFASASPHSVAGTGRLVARLNDVNGWHRTIELQRQTAFTGGHFTFSGNIDLIGLLHLVTTVQEATGVGSDHYMLTVQAEINADGVVAGQQVQDTFAPELLFRFDPLQLQVERAGDTRADSSADLFTSSKAGTVQVQRSEPSVISAPGISLRVSTARRVAIAGGLISASATMALFVMMRFALNGQGPSHIQRRYGQWIVPVRQVSVAAQDRVVEVAAITTLARLAERSGGVILHEQRDGLHYYLVHDGDLLYRYEGGA